MWNYPEKFDVIVIGAGHAGCEAAHAAAVMGCRTLLLTMNLDTIGKMSCNPSIGGTAKGHMVREIDALGGVMGKIADETAIHYKMLNLSKGPAVWSPRTQNDKIAYQTAMKKKLEENHNLLIIQATIDDFLIENRTIVGVETKEKVGFFGKTVLLSSGTFMRGLIHIGTTTFSGGRSGDKSSEGLSDKLKRLGFRLGRLKTGTPPRVNRHTVDTSQMEPQWGDEGMRFSFDPPDKPALPQVPCYLTYTNEETKRVVLEHLHLSPLYSGKISSIGPRYCPCIEDKVVRFGERDRHRIFIEPEGIETHELYINGISTSLPFEVQLKMIRTIPGLERAEIIRPAYAIEYDYLESGQLLPTLETRIIEGLFSVGQVNGTTGYEEAAGQGIMAGINAALKVQGRAPFILKRSDAYIGVMIDELITKDLDEPYRMFTSRAEHRLLLRQDNADQRLRRLGHHLGLIDEEKLSRLSHKEKVIKEQADRLVNTYQNYEGKSFSLAQLLRRPDFNYKKLHSHFPETALDHGNEINFQIEIQLKYAGYIERQQQEIARLEGIEKFELSPHLDYSEITALSAEAREKLIKIKPVNLGQASRLSGVTQADIHVLMVALRR